MVHDVSWSHVVFNLLGINLGFLAYYLIVTKVFKAKTSVTRAEVWMMCWGFFCGVGQLMFKDELCTCSEYCTCLPTDTTPCECSGMEQDPHCQWCCLHLPLEQEIKWRQEMGEPVVGGVSDCCGALVEEQVGEITLHICRTCRKSCHPVAAPRY